MYNNKNECQIKISLHIDKEKIKNRKNKLRYDNNKIDNEEFEEIK